MKNLIGIAFLLLASVAQAAPFLYTDPVPGATECVLELDGTIHRADPVTADEVCRIDLAGIAVGDHTARVKARNMWGESEFSTPFLFPKTLPPLPTGSRLSDK